ncbi:MAG TPA: tRNA (adenosine(37)-N6)-threonylcarbamoyltransferase complex dimerization subunit type 1 TsaB [Steroidobacteraceae bacterium]|nr:tRNA (adenosine(37)-N6)-threonylcarbamoyltransferase complex dimerization subunit type 1 TsaB [Steroidobacteraceae bacterium]
MRILAIDTATESCSAALLIDGRVLAREALLERGHAEHILPMVDALLREARLALRELSAIAFGRGPGAFTGVRLAASVTQGLAYGAALPVVPISDLRAIAEHVLKEDSAIDRVLVCTDARMREVYWAWFERGQAGYAVEVGEERVGPAAEVTVPDGRSAQVTAQAGRFAAAGSGFAAYPELRSTVAAPAALILESLRPHAREVATLAAVEVAAGRVLPPEQALPHYLRDDVTQTPHARSLN